MTIALLLLMTYEMIGSEMHEWIGMAMFILFVLHHVLNIQWSKNLFKGRYTVFRFLQNTLVILILFSMLCSMVSGIMLSRHIFTFLSFDRGISYARTLHLLSAYWGFVLMAVHLGLHWNMVIGMAKKLFKKNSKIRVWMLRVITVFIAGYGVYAFLQRQIGSYMLLKNQFVFFDFDEPIIILLIDYLTIMGLFTCIGYYVSKVLRKKINKRL